MFGILTACFLALAAVQPKVNPHASQDKIDPATVITVPEQELHVDDFAADGWILDIGGGGEGIIGRIKGAQVVAIDLYSWGMNRTPPGPLKLVMDATDLKFLDGSFGTVTSFFTLMYMNPDQQEKAMREAFRVLRPGGRMRIWEVPLPVAPEPGKKLIVYRFRFTLPSETVTTGYGTGFPSAPVDLDYYVRLAKKAGFAVEESALDGGTFRLTLRK